MKKFITSSFFTLAFFAAILNPAHSKSIASPGLTYLNGHYSIQQDSATIEFNVAGKCGMCKKKIEKAVMGIAGVKAANWDKAAKFIKVDVSDTKVTREVISKAIAAVGYDTQFNKADDKVYEALPKCCQYERMK